jgi:hypothetical protein
VVRRGLAIFSLLYTLWRSYTRERPVLVGDLLQQPFHCYLVAGGMLFLTLCFPSIHFRPLNLQFSLQYIVLLYWA